MAVLACVFATSAAGAALVVALSEIRDRAGVSQSLIGVGTAGSLAAGIIAQFIAGPQLDSGRGRAVLIASTLLGAAGSLVIGFFANPAAAIAGQVLIGAGAGACAPAVFALMSVKSHNTGFLTGVASSVDEGGVLAGPLLGAVLLGFVGITATMGVFAGIVAAVAVWVALTPAKEFEYNHENLDHDTNPGAWRRLLKNPGVASATLGLAAVNVPFGVFRTLWDRYIEDLGGGNGLVAATYVASSLSYIMLGPLGGKLTEKLGGGKIAFIGLGGCGALVVTYGLAPSAGWVFAIDFLYMLGLAAAYPGLLNIINTSTKKHERGAAHGVALGVSGAAAIPSAVAGAWVYENYGRFWCFAAAGVATLALCAAGARRWAATREIAGSAETSGE